MTSEPGVSGSTEAMTGHVPRVGTAEKYRRFGREALGRSPGYEILAEAVSSDESILAFLGALPVEKRQPNLLFAAARYLLDAPPEIHTLRGLVRDRASELLR